MEVEPLAVVLSPVVEALVEVLAGLLMSPVWLVVELIVLVALQVPFTWTWRPTQVLKSCVPVKRIGEVERAVRSTVCPFSWSMQPTMVCSPFAVLWEWSIAPCLPCFALLSFFAFLSVFWVSVVVCPAVLPVVDVVGVV